MVARLLANCDELEKHTEDWLGKSGRCNSAQINYTYGYK